MTLRNVCKMGKREQFIVRGRSVSKRAFTALATLPCVKCGVEILPGSVITRHLVSTSRGGDVSKMGYVCAACCPRKAPGVEVIYATRQRISLLVGANITSAMFDDALAGAARRALIDGTLSPEVVVAEAARINRMAQAISSARELSTVV